MKHTLKLALVICLFGASSNAQDNIYTSYPVFGDKQPYSYNDKRVATVTEKGLVRELIVQCKKDNDDNIIEGIMIHDHINDVFCDSKNECHASLSRAISRTCAG